MHIDLYPADYEITNPKQDFLDLLRQDGAHPLAPPPNASALSFSVAGDFALLTRRIQEWLAQRSGRSAAPPSVCEASLLEKDSSVTIQVHCSLTSAESSAS